MPEPITNPLRRLVVCCDGTWNGTDRGPAATNVLRLARIVEPWSRDGIPQVVWYHPGVGTGNPVDKALGGAIGIGLAPDVRAAYAFIVNNYNPGDEIFLFGFSRGAFTARCVAGLIGALGVLHDREMGRFMEAWNWYRIPPPERNVRDLDISFPLRTRDVPIRCIGVWDTVGAMGVPRNRLTRDWSPCADTYRFYDTQLGPHVRYAFHALAIDEKRGPFAPVLWNQDAAPQPDQDIRQVWFAGVHSDVGGSYEDHGTSDIALIWMVAQVQLLLELDVAGFIEERDTRAIYGQGPLHESYSWKWWFAGQNHRAVGPGANQYVHETALARLGFDGYPRNPNFNFQALPVWKRDAFEQSCSWSKEAWPDSTPHLPARAESFCAKVVRRMEGNA